MSEAKPLSKRDAALNERRLHILSAAIDCLVEKGFHNTGMRDISKRADVSLGNLYNHFPGKHDMLLGIAELEADELSKFVKVLLGKEPVEQTLKTFIDEFGAFASNREVAILTLEITAEAMRQQDIATLFLEARAALTNALVSLIQRGADQGVFRDTAATVETACFILDLIESSAARKLVEGANIKSNQNNVCDFVLAALKS